MGILLLGPYGLIVLPAHCGFLLSVEMTSYVALFRAVNVGGTELLPMKQLQALCMDLGLAHVQTYIQGGKRRYQTSDVPFAYRKGFTVTVGTHSLVDLYERLRRSWSRETGRHWRKDNPASGQCGVTALVIHGELGGEILKTEVNGAWHFYNQIDGRRVDFTMSQFDSPIFYDDLPSNWSEALADTTSEQYRLLRERVIVCKPE